MDLLEIRYFLATAAAGSLSRAAVRLGVSQPALSRQIGRLETSLGRELFYRHGRGVALTEAGRRFQAVAQNVTQQLTDVQEELSGGALDAVGNVTLGIPPSLSASMGADLALRFAAGFPRARLRIREAFSAILLEWTEAARVDLAVLYDARSNASLIATPLLLEDLFLIEPPAQDSGTPHAGPVGLIELTQRDCVLPGPENGLRRVVDAACAAEGVRPRVLTEVDCVAALKQLVERGSVRRCCHSAPCTARCARASCACGRSAPPPCAPCWSSRRPRTRLSRRLSVPLSPWCRRRSSAWCRWTSCGASSATPTARACTIARWPDRAGDRNRRSPPGNLALGGWSLPVS
jgi:LysR family nitrogen assimilation transcriptional regulator